MFRWPFCRSLATRLGKLIRLTDQNLSTPHPALEAVFAMNRNPWLPQLYIVYVHASVNIGAFAYKFHCVWGWANACVLGVLFFLGIVQ